MSRKCWPSVPPGNVSPCRHSSRGELERIALRPSATSAHRSGILIVILVFGSLACGKPVELATRGKSWRLYGSAIRIGRPQVGGSLDRQGTYVVEPQFDIVESFSEGLAIVRIGDKDWGRRHLHWNEREGLARVQIGDQGPPASGGSLTGKAPTLLSPNLTMQGRFRKGWRLYGSRLEDRQVGVH